MKLAAQALLQTPTTSFPALQARHASERCVHGSAGGFVTGRVPSTQGCQIISGLPHPTPETQTIPPHPPTSQGIPHLLPSSAFRCPLPLPASKAPPELCLAVSPPLHPHTPICSCPLPKEQMEGRTIRTKIPVEVLSQTM